MFRSIRQQELAPARRLCLLRQAPRGNRHFTAIKKHISDPLFYRIRNVDSEIRTPKGRRQKDKIRNVDSKTRAPKERTQLDPPPSDRSVLSPNVRITKEPGTPKRLAEARQAALLNSNSDGPTIRTYASTRIAKYSASLRPPPIVKHPARVSLRTHGDIPIRKVVTTRGADGRYKTLPTQDGKNTSLGRVANADLYTRRQALGNRLKSEVFKNSGRYAGRNLRELEFGGRVDTELSLSLPEDAARKLAGEDTSTKSRSPKEFLLEETLDTWSREQGSNNPPTKRSYSTLSKLRRGRYAPGLSGQPLPIQSSRSFSSSTRGAATLRPQDSRSNADDALINSDFDPDSRRARAKISSVRERLRLWTQNRSGTETPLPLLSTSPAQALAEAEDLGDRFEAEEDIETPLFDQDGLVDIGNSRSFLLRGDLVELVTFGEQREIAVYIRRLETQLQFYTMSGRWVNRTSKGVNFFVPHFFSPEDLDPIIPYLPPSDVPEQMQDKLMHFKRAPPRQYGQPILARMLSFWEDTDSTYRSVAFKLDRAHEHLADAHNYKYATLEEITDNLLGGYIPKDSNGNYPPTALYAVYRAMTRDDDLGFRPLRIHHRVAGQFEISPRNEVVDIHYTAHMCRLLAEENVASVEFGTAIESKTTAPLRKFISQAQALIDQSRSCRKITPFGTIGPNMTHSTQNLPHMLWSPPHHSLIRFLESWAALGTLSKTSTMNSIGPLLLRAIDRYPGRPLDQSCAWTFLQEIGVLPPWQSRAAFELRLPATGFRLRNKTFWPVSPKMRDHMREFRKDCRLPVYCIDDETANEIDDGVSVEVADRPGEYWVHIHVADPGSFLRPDHPTSQAAENHGENVYLPERIVTMFQPQMVEARLSLQNDRPVLTFSARMNASGDLLENRISCGVIKNVFHLSNATLRQVLDLENSSTVEDVELTIGAKTQPPAVRRRLYTSDEIPSECKDELKLLNQLGEARRLQMARKGAISFFAPRPSVTLSGSTETTTRTDRAHFYPSDPALKLRYQPSSSNPQEPAAETVRNLMTIAAEVAAQWCAARNIPIPYRVTVSNPDLPSPTDYLNKTLLPALSPTGQLPPEIALGYLKRMGPVQPSSTPGPHLALGVGMYAKCTSPLRRFGDLLVHWQIQAALVEEARTGESLVGSTREDYLPFSKKEMDKILPKLFGREKAIVAAHRSVSRASLIHFLIRAWHFKEAEIPETFDFVVRKVLKGGRVAGRIDFLGAVDGNCTLPDWIEPGEVKEGDRFEARFKDLNVYWQTINVEVVRKLEKEEGAFGRRGGGDDGTG